MIPVRRAVLLTLLISFTASAVVSAQSRKAEGDRDHPTARQEWFRKGRTLRGEAAAGRLYEGYRHKMRLRAAQQQRRKDANKSATGSIAALSSTAGATASSGISSFRWTPLGPAPIDASAEGYGNVAGRVTAIAVDQSDRSGNTVFIGGAYGGVWKTTNGADPDRAAVKWTPLTDDQPTLAVGAIALKPDNLDCSSASPSNCVILVGTGEPDNAGDSYYGLGFLRSPDGGVTWSPIIGQTADGRYSFRGLGISKIAFSTDDANAVVATAAATEMGILEGGETDSSVRGIYYSKDAGVTWLRAAVTDAKDGPPVDPGSVTGLAYVPAGKSASGVGTFYAAYRYHGIYSSTDGGQTWLRLSNQPPPIASSNCPATPFNSSCALYRAELAVQPITGELYVWDVWIDQSGNEVDEGIYRSSDGGNAWVPLHIANSADGITNCGDGAGCGAHQGAYNLFLAAVPNGTSTDIYVGAVNIFKCSPNIANANCTAPNSWLNLTHVYSLTCQSISNVHPDQHAVAFGIPGTDAIYFGNDGGVYRSVRASQLGSGTCPSASNPNAGSNPFDNLNNSTLGSLTQFVSFSQDPSSDMILQAGAQDNGTSATATAPDGWRGINGGDGGYNEIDQLSPATWFSEYPNLVSGVPYVAIEKCIAGAACNGGLFLPFVSRTQVPDATSFYTPYLLDAQMPSRMLIGTCRVWRGDSSGTTFVGVPLSPNFYDSTTFNDTSTCTSTEPMVRSIATGGPLGSAGSQVVYAGTEDGNVYVTTTASAGPSGWCPASPCVVSPRFHSIPAYPISDIAIDPNDKTGRTAYWTVMGFTGGPGHVWKTKDAGATRVDVTANLPDVPADTVLVDPIDTTGSTIYVGTDVGVFVSLDGGQTWQEYGVGLPNVAITKMRAFVSDSQKLLRVSTYGRGIWQAPLATATPGFQMTLEKAEVTTYPGQSVQINGTISATNGYTQPITLSCIGAALETCTPTPATIAPGLTAQSFSLTVSNSTAGDFSFAVQGKGADGLTRTASLTVHVADFSLSIQSNAVIGHGDRQSLPLTITPTHGFNSNLNLSCSELPADATCTFVNSSVPVSGSTATSVDVQIFGGVTVAPGTYPVTIKAQTADGALMHSATVSLQIVSNITFALLAADSSLGAFKAGQPIPSVNVNVASADGYSGTVNLTCSPSCTVSPTPVTLTAASPPVPVSVNISPVSSGANLTATLTGNDGTKKQTLTFTYAVQDFAVSAPASASLLVGTSATFQFSVAPIAGYTGALTATCDASQIPGAPCMVSPQSLSLTGIGPQQVAATISVPSGVNAKNYQVTLTEADGGLSHSATLNLAVQDFSLASGITVTARQGSAGSASLPILSINGFGGQVTFECTSGLPAGAVCAFTPNIATVTAAGGAAVLTISTLAPSAAQPGGTTASNHNGSATLALYAISAWLPVFALVLISRPRSLARWIGLAVIVGSVTVMVSCGGSGPKTNQFLNPVRSPGTPTGSYNVVVTATSGAAQRTTTVTLNVQ